MASLLPPRNQPQWDTTDRETHFDSLINWQRFFYTLGSEGEIEIEREGDGEREMVCGTLIFFSLCLQNLSVWLCCLFHIVWQS